jgi:hypothetical protein
MHQTIAPYPSDNIDALNDYRHSVARADFTRFLDFQAQALRIEKLAVSQQGTILF